MGTPDKFDLDRRLEAYSATLRAPALRDVLKRSIGNWQRYAAVTSSAMAMAAGVPAATGISENTVEPAASFSPARQNAASSRGNPLIEAARLRIPKQPDDQTAAPQAAPVIAPNGIAPVFGIPGTIQSGQWITIYGNNLAAGTFNWNGDFPLTLGGTSVTINGKSAYLMYVSPGQINLQAPDDTATGTVAVIVTTSLGSATSTVTLSQFAPAFNLIGVPGGVPVYVSGVILRSNGRGNYGNGSYDLLGPDGKTFGYPTVAARPGDMVELFGYGFGPTTPAVPAGQAFSGAAPLNNPVTLYINSVTIQPGWVGISSAGLVQINFTVPPGLGQGAVPIQAMVGGVMTPRGALFQLAGYPIGPVATTYNPPVAGTVGVPSFGGTFGGTFGGSFGGSGGGSFGSYGVHRKRKRHQPRLQFPPK